MIQRLLIGVSFCLVFGTIFTKSLSAQEQETYGFVDCHYDQYDGRDSADAPFALELNKYPTKEFWSVRMIERFDSKFTAEHFDHEIMWWRASNPSEGDKNYIFSPAGQH